jgi:outer membrane protein assembly factor BamA
MKDSRRTLFLVGVLCVGALSLRSAPSSLVRSLRFTGSAALSVDEIERVMRTRAGAPWSPRGLEEDLSRIRDRYRVEGYWQASAVLESVRFFGDSSAVDVEISLHEGLPTRVAGIELEGLTLIGTGEILSMFDTRVGDPARQESLERDVAWLVKRLEEAGRPFAEVRIAEATLRPGPESDSLQLRIEVHEGESLTIDEVRIEGARETSPDYILRETRIRRGEPYLPDRLLAVRARLSRLNIFSSVNEPELYVRGGKGGVLIRVQEGSTNTFDGIAGYVPARAPGEAGYVTGLVSLSMRNLFGTGRKLAFRWERVDQRTQELGVRYTEPWLFGLPLGLGGSFEQRQQDTAFVRRAADLRMDFALTDRLTLGVVGTAESVIPSADTTIRRSYQSSATTIGADLGYDSRDDVISPTEGVRYRADYHHGRKSLPHENRVSIQRVGVDLELYVSTFPRQVLALGVHGRQVEGSDLQEGELYRFGGTTTMRGYRENEFLGSRIGWANLEYRFLAGRRTFFYGFVDGGYYFRPGDLNPGSPAAEAFKYGLGVGVRLETGLGNMGVSFAFGEGDTFSTAKIHIGILGDF